MQKYRERIIASHIAAANRNQSKSRVSQPESYDDRTQFIGKILLFIFASAIVASILFVWYIMALRGMF